MKTARLVILLALALMLLAAVPVSAGAPIVDTVGDDIDYAMPEDLCPGIEVRNHEVYTGTIRTWLDDEGNVLRSEAHWEGADNLYNPANPGVVLADKFALNTIYNARTGKNYVSGVSWRITIPGYGTAVVRTGRWYGAEYPDGHIAGKDSFLSPQDMEQFCSYLAGN